MMRNLLIAAAAWSVAAVALAQHDHGMAGQDPAMGHAPPAGDGRTLVHFPEPMRLHTLANMRDHMAALREIQEALARESYDQAGEVAEQRLGMSSLALHGAHESSRFMPEGMQAVGSEMHRAASRLAVAAKDAGATGDLRPVLAAMARVTGQCVACHAGYRVQ